MAKAMRGKNHGGKTRSKVLKPIWRVLSRLHTGAALQIGFA
jgi:hypothetical protein